MERRKFTRALLSVPVLWGMAPGAHAQFNLSEHDAVLGVRTALERGAVIAVDLLSRKDGFLGNPRVRIPLPGFLQDASRLLKTMGQQKRMDELVTAMNRAAEAAMPEARLLLVNAVKSMSVEDARRIVTGGDTSVTTFFADKTRAPLAERFLPIVTRQTEKVALAEKYNALASRAATFGLLKEGESSVQQYVTGKALDGLYVMIGDEERKIRQNPMGTGSAILRRVFGSLR